MKTTIKHGLSGAETASGTVVVIDVFRSSNTILMLLAQGASSVIPVMTVKDAFDLNRRHPEHLLVGERDGIKLDGFDMGNSPNEASKMKLRGREVILTTSGGTRAIGHLRKADKVLIGSFGNAAALTDVLKRTEPPLVTWLAVGTEGVRRAIEDELCARYLKGMVEGEPLGHDAMRNAILDGEGAARLRRLGQHDDFSHCLAVDVFSFVPELRTRGPLMRFVKQEEV